MCKRRPSNPRYGPFDVKWDWSHTLRGNYSGDFGPPIEQVPFLPAGNRNAILQVVRGMSTGEFFEELLTDPEMEEVASETVGVPERFSSTGTAEA